MKYNLIIEIIIKMFISRVLRYKCCPLDLKKIDIIINNKEIEYLTECVIKLKEKINIITKENDSFKLKIEELKNENIKLKVIELKYNFFTHIHPKE